MTSIPDIHVPLCPRCGDPVTSGCYPARGTCAVTDDDTPAPIEAPGMSALTDEEWAALYPQEGTPYGPAPEPDRKADEA